MAKDLLKPDNLEPTVAHKFLQMLRDKNLILKYFSANIDNLEERVDWQSKYKDRKLVHGSRLGARCVNPSCKSVKKKKVYKQGQKCEGEECCDQLLKPDITFFGEAIPFHFDE